MYNDINYDINDKNNIRMKYQQNKNYQKTKMGKKTSIWTFQATKK